MTLISIKKAFNEIIEFLMEDFELIFQKEYGSISRILIFTNRKVKIKVVIEKQVLSVEVGSEGDDFWIGLSLMKYFIDEEPYKYLEPEQMIKYLKNNLSKLQNVFLKKSNLKQLDQLKYNYANRLPLNSYRSSSTE